VFDGRAEPDPDDVSGLDQPAGARTNRAQRFEWLRGNVTTLELHDVLVAMNCWLSPPMTRR
jgi:hypothetical protein